MCNYLENVGLVVALWRNAELAVDLDGLLNCDGANHALGGVGRCPGCLVVDPVNGIDGAVDSWL